MREIQEIYCTKVSFNIKRAQKIIKRDLKKTLKEKGLKGVVVPLFGDRNCLLALELAISTLGIEKVLAVGITSTNPLEYGRVQNFYEKRIEKLYKVRALVLKISTKLFSENARMVIHSSQEDVKYYEKIFIQEGLEKAQKVAIDNNYLLLSFENYTQKQLAKLNLGNSFSLSKQNTYSIFASFTETELDILNETALIFTNLLKNIPYSYFNCFYNQTQTSAYLFDYCLRTNKNIKDFKK